MAVKYVIDDTTMTKIADPLRELTGETGELTPNEMADAGESAVAEVDTQTALMEQIQAALESKAGSGGINPSGTLNITENGSYDVANYASAEVNVPSEGCNHTSVTQATPSITVSSSGLITAKATQSAGLVSAGTKSATKQLTTQGAKTVTPSSSEQVAVPAGTYVTGDVKVAAVSGGDSGNDAEQTLIDLIERDIVTISLPDGIKRISSHAFDGCSSLSAISIPDTVTQIISHAFFGCSSLSTISLPDKITTIGGSAFGYCSALRTITLPKNMRSLGTYAFEYCSELVEVTFQSVPTTTYSTIFKNCPALTTINVPWAEGAVANAPWGATNATINYNYAG